MADRKGFNTERSSTPSLKRVLMSDWSVFILTIPLTYLLWVVILVGGHYINLVKCAFEQLPESLAEQAFIQWEVPIL
jgi:hypothetical protein